MATLCGILGTVSECGFAAKCDTASVHSSRTGCPHERNLWKPKAAAEYIFYLCMSHVHVSWIYNKHLRISQKRYPILSFHCHIRAQRFKIKNKCLTFPQKHNVSKNLLSNVIIYEWQKILAFILAETREAKNVNSYKVTFKSKPRYTKEVAVLYQQYGPNYWEKFKINIFGEWT